MSKITKEEIKKILPINGPSFEEVKNYLEKYNDEYIVIKCGGSVLVDQNLFDNFIKDIYILNKLGFIPIVIHGGGKRISIKLNETGIKSDFVDGLRVTDKKSINIVEEVLNIFNNDARTTQSPFVTVQLWCVVTFAPSRIRLQSMESRYINTF